MPPTVPAKSSGRSTRRRLAGRLAIPFFLSGASALIAELCWFRALAVHLGGSAAALNIVLMTFMAGLALGARLVSGQAGRRHPLAFYALLEVLLSAYISLSALFVRLGGVAFEELLPSLGHETAAAQLARLVTSAVVLLAPTLMMGATAPLLIAATVERGDDAASATGWLYGVNTLGAAVGGLLGGCFLIVWFGVTRSLQTAGALNLSAATLAALVAWSERRRKERTVGALDPGEPSARSSGGELRLALLAGAIGFLGMALEVILIRLLVFLIGSTYYSHVVAISAFLLGVAVGSLLIAGRGRRRPLGEGSLQAGLALFGIAIAGAGLLSEHLPFLAERVLVQHGALGLGPLGIKLVAAFALVALPATASGALLPVLVHTWARECGDTRRAASLAFSADTAGGVLGVGLTGFWIIESVGVRGALYGVAAAAIAVAATLAWRRSAGSSGPWLAAAAAGLLALAFAKHARPLVLDSLIFRQLGSPPLLFYREDDVVSVSVVETPGGVRSLLINGLVAARVQPRDAQPLATSVVAMACHPHPERVLIAGLGAGTDAGVAGLYRGVHVLVVEIAQAVIDAFPFFDPLTYGASHGPSIRVERGDARHFLQATRERFDLILPDVYISALTGTAYLYNVEFYALCARRLRPGGRLVMQLEVGTTAPDPSRPPIDSIIAAGLLRSFPYAALIRLPKVGLSYFIGANEPISFPERAATTGERPEVAALLRATGLDREGGLRAYRIAEAPELRRALAGVPPSTDDHPTVDYAQALGRRERALVW